MPSRGAVCPWCGAQAQCQLMRDGDSKYENHKCCRFNKDFAPFWSGSAGASIYHRLCSLIAETEHSAAGDTNAAICVEPSATCGTAGDGNGNAVTDDQCSGWSLGATYKASASTTECGSDPCDIEANYQNTGAVTDFDRCCEPPPAIMLCASGFGVSTESFVSPISGSSRSVP